MNWGTKGGGGEEGRGKGRDRTSLDGEEKDGL